MQLSRIPNSSSQLFIMTTLIGLGTAGLGAEESTPLSFRYGGSEAARAGFTRLDPADTGIRFQNFLKEQNIKKYLHNGSGGCAGDFDGDGLPDLYLVSQDGPNKLWRQTSAWKFEDVTEVAGVNGGDQWGTGACFVDIDNDGDLDLHVGNLGGNDLLYINQGDGTFKEEGKLRGIDHAGPTIMGAFCDYDRDGDLDCYLVTYRLYQLAEESNENIKLRYVDGKATVHPDYEGEYGILNGNLIELGRRDVLLRNDGKGHFTDVSGFAGMGTDRGQGLSATWYDYNNDGWPDLYVANDFYAADRLWKNRGDGTFVDVLPQLTTQTPWFAMGSDFGDINRDGWFDTVVADMSAMNHYRQKMEMGAMGSNAWFLDWGEPRQLMRNIVSLNAGGRRFLETGFMSGLDSTGWTWAARFSDLDCDGWEDAIFTNGMIRDVNNSDYTLELKRLKGPENKQAREKLRKKYDKPAFDHNKVFRNRGDLHFDDVSEAWGYNEMSASYGLILADFDRDGDLDAITVNMNQPAGIYRNDTNTGNRVLIELRGKQSNHFGVGARLRLKSASGWQTRMLTLARGYQSGDEPVLHFGLGNDDRIERLEIDWPSGAAHVIENLDVNRLHTITEPDGNFMPNPAGDPVQQLALFSMDAVPGFELEHREDAYDDFIKEPLLPWKLSNLGPGIAVGDADGDGDEDVWVGGATGQAGSLVTRGDDGRWTVTSGGPWAANEASEDMGAIFYDPDKDGDLDLYVSSGGNQTHLEGKPILEDRLYIHSKLEGQAAYAKAGSDPDPDKRSYESAGAVAAADFDRDGDMDLFVGSRITPGEFSKLPPQRLLINNGAGQSDAIDAVAPELKELGMVTSAMWTDVDNDGRLDLMVTSPWNPVRLFRQTEDSKLVGATEESGISGHYGWWQGIDGGDLDGDGDIDYVVTNLGLNTKYHCSKEKPFRIYAEDFDGNGRCDLVEAEYEGDKLYPMRGRSCSSQAMPFIKKKFKTYHQFAISEVDEIYPQQKLETARVLKLTNLESSVLINDGKGHFEIRPLPALAQIAPSFGVVVEDFDGDGNLDAAIAQNFYSPQLETGRMSGGLGIFLKGRGDGSFTEIWPQKSGIWIHQDAKSLAKVDLNYDGAPDLVCGTNNGSVRPMINQTRGPSVRWSTISLKGAKGNPTGVGSRLIIETSKGRKLVKEVHAGSSYLSQSTARQFVALAKDEHILKVTTRWPRGEESTVEHGGYLPDLKIHEP